MSVIDTFLGLYLRTVHREHGSRPPLLRGSVCYTSFHQIGKQCDILTRQPGAGHGELNGSWKIVPTSNCFCPENRIWRSWKSRLCCPIQVGVIAIQARLSWPWRQINKLTRQLTSKIPQECLVCIFSGKYSRIRFWNNAEKITEQKLCSPLNSELYGNNIIFWEKSWCRRTCRSTLCSVSH